MPPTETGPSTGLSWPLSWRRDEAPRTGETVIHWDDGWRFAKATDEYGLISRDQSPPRWFPIPPPVP